MNAKALPLMFLFFFCHFCQLTAQNSEEANPASTYFDMTGFPQWSKDMRRAGIVAFGSFPFTYFFTNFSYDFYRTVDNDWNRAYAPWPMKGPGSIDKSTEEKMRILGIAAAGSILIAVVDFGIVKAKRNRAARQAEMHPEEAPDIIRRPIKEDEDEDPAGEENPDE